ncbi:MAG: calcium/proton exchanger [Acidobacteriota bacterium]|nr:calcium/proton exchanger [Acidobacteriota bacterium]
MLVPITVAVRYTMPGSQTLIFALSAASMIPLARLLSDATENLAELLGPTVGGLLNVTFGNAGELVIGFFALQHGLHRIVKASISGSILVNLLLTLGISMLAGGLRKKTLNFNPLSARTQATMLLLAAVSLIFPAAYHFLAGPTNSRREADLSLEFAVILLLTYALGLLFTLHTHRQLLTVHMDNELAEREIWTATRGYTMLALSAVGIGWMGEILVGSIEVAAKTLGLTDLFVGIVILAIAGNAAESTSAIRAALQGRMDLSVGIGAGSSIQIALFVAPCLILCSHFVGPGPMDLVFTPVEVLALVLAIAVTTQIAGDGESNWLEGVQLIAVYIMLAVIFFYLPEAAT